MTAPNWDAVASTKIHPSGVHDIDWLQILNRIECGEGDQTEFKHRFDESSVGKAVCAFANTKGGVIILGVTNTQEIVGVDQDAEDLQEMLISFLQTCCSSPVEAHLGRHKDPKGWVHWIDVPPPERTGADAV